MPETMSETHLTSRIWNVISSISFGYHFVLKYTENQYKWTFFAFQAPAYIKSMPETMLETHLTSRIRNAISGISIRCYLYLNMSEIGINDHFIAFQALRLLRHTLNQCRKIFRKLISHLTFGMHYLAFLSGAICT